MTDAAKLVHAINDLNDRLKSVEAKIDKISTFKISSSFSEIGYTIRPIGKKASMNGEEDE